MAKIIITRKKAMACGNQKQDVYLYNNYVGTLSNGGALEFSADVGTHILSFNAKQKYGSSTNFQVVVNSPDETIRLNAYFDFSGNLIIEYADNAPHFSTNGSAMPYVQPKKKNGAKTLVTVFVCIVVFFVAVGIIGALFDDNASVDGGINSGESNSVSANDTVTTVNVGETLNANGLKITYIKVEDWESGNMFIKPDNGYKFIRAYFVMENTTSRDYIMGGYDFECYADNAKMDYSIYGDKQIDLFATVSSGRKLEGYVYFEVPINAQTIEIEYETNFWTDKKAIFKVK